MVKIFLERFDDKYKPASRQEVTGANGGPCVILTRVVNVDDPASFTQFEAKPAIPALPQPPSGTISTSTDGQDGVKTP